VPGTLAIIFSTLAVYFFQIEKMNVNEEKESYNKQQTTTNKQQTTNKQPTTITLGSNLSFPAFCIIALFTEWLPRSKTMTGDAPFSSLALNQ
jgi:hypothetical protein